MEYERGTRHFKVFRRFQGVSEVSGRFWGVLDGIQGVLCGISGELQCLFKPFKRVPEGYQDVLGSTIITESWYNKKKFRPHGHDSNVESNVHYLDDFFLIWPVDEVKVKNIH